MPVEGEPEGGAKAVGSLLAPPPNQMFAPPVLGGVNEHAPTVVAQKFPPVTILPSPLESVSLQIDIPPSVPANGPFVRTLAFSNTM